MKTKDKVKRQKKQIHKRKCWCLGVSMSGVILASLLFVQLVEGNTKQPVLESGLQESSPQESSSKMTDPVIEAVKNIDNNREEEQSILLVNREHMLPEDYEVELHWLNNGQHAVAEEIYSSLQEMLTDGSEEGLIFTVASGYRSREKQQQLLEEDIEAAMQNEGLTRQQACDKEMKETMPPGYSEHESGLAVNIVSFHYQILDHKQEETKENIWLREKCSKYGFILRYPNGSSEITGINYEPWHFRYVGREAAEKIMSRGITLEEYLNADISKEE